MHRPPRPRFRSAAPRHAAPARWVLAAAVLWSVAIGCSQATVSETAVEVLRVALDPGTGSPVVLLREVEGERILPIWIGPDEARSIASRLAREHPPRPNSHDLVKRLIDRLDGDVLHIVVSDLRNGVYFARIRLGLGDRQFEVDARPSDAIAIALRFEAPIFVRDALLDRPHEAAPDRQEEALHL